MRPANLFFEYFFWVAPKRHLHGITIASLSSRSESQLAFPKCEQAIELIRRYDPRAYACLLANVRAIIIFGDGSTYGTWYDERKILELYDDWLKSPETSVEHIACVIVHEVTHSRLRKLGFGYAEKDRLRIERICYRAQRNFARRLPDAGYLVKHYNERMKTAREAEFSNEGRGKAKLKALRELGCPEIIVRWLERRWRATLARSATNERGGRVSGTRP